MSRQWGLTWRSASQPSTWHAFFLNMRGRGPRQPLLLLWLLLLLSAACGGHGAGREVVGQGPVQHAGWARCCTYLYCQAQKRVGQTVLLGCLGPCSLSSSCAPLAKGEAIRAPFGTCRPSVPHCQPHTRVDVMALFLSHGALKPPNKARLTVAWLVAASCGTQALLGPAASFHGPSASGLAEQPRTVVLPGLKPPRGFNPVDAAELAAPVERSPAGRATGGLDPSATEGTILRAGELSGCVRGPPPVAIDSRGASPVPPPGAGMHAHLRSNGRPPATNRAQTSRGNGWVLQTISFIAREMRRPKHAPLPVRASWSAPSSVPAVDIGPRAQNTLR